jgi:hypothetical protein
MSTDNPTTFKCCFCQKTIPVLGAFKITRTEECPYCAKRLHCCKMCKFYDSRVYNGCIEPNAERVVDKEKDNFCDYFSLSNGVNNGPSKDDLVNAADALFKK